MTVALDIGDTLHRFSGGSGVMLELNRRADGALVIVRVENGLVKSVSEPLSRAAALLAAAQVLAGVEAAMTQANMRALAALAIEAAVDSQRRASATTDPARGQA